MPFRTESLASLIAITSVILLASMYYTVTCISGALTPAYGDTQPLPFEVKGTVQEIDISEMKSSLVPYANNETYFELYDWNYQSGKVLFTSGKFIGIMDANATDVRVISLPSNMYDDEIDSHSTTSPVSRALFADNNTIYALVKSNLLVYKYNSSGLVYSAQHQLDGTISSFDIIRDNHNNSNSGFKLVLVESYRTLWLADSTGKKISRLYDAESASDVAVSPDGRSIAFVVRKSIEGNSYLGDVQLLVLNIEDNKIHEVFHERSSSTPEKIKWTSNGQLLTYQEGGGVRIPTAYLYVTNTDGSFRQTIFGGVDAPEGYVVSKEGSTVMVGINPYLGTTVASKLYRLDLAHPIPEFGTSLLTMPIIAAAIGSIIIAGRYRLAGHKEWRSSSE